LKKAEQTDAVGAEAGEGECQGKIVRFSGSDRRVHSGPRQVPARLVSPAEQGLRIVVSALIQQLGFHGAYNSLLDAAENVKTEREGKNSDHS